MSNYKPKFITAADVPRERVDWILPGFLPKSKFSLLIGDAGVGKTTVMLDLLARITSGRPMPDGNWFDPANALILNAEDGLGDTLRPRLEEAGADLDRVRMLDCTEGLLTVPKYADALRDEVLGFNASVVVVDPLNAFVDSSFNTHNEHESRQALAPLVALAHECKTAIIGIRHLNKKSDLPSLYRATGSTAFVNVPRVVLIAMEHPNCHGQFVLKTIKANLSRKPEPLVYEIVEGEDTAHPVVRWHGSINLEDAASRSLREEAAEWLKECLRDGPLLGTEVIEAAEAAGHKERTVRRAMGDLDIRPRKGVDGRSYWGLPEKPPTDGDSTDSDRDSEFWNLVA